MTQALPLRMPHPLGYSDWVRNKHMTHDGPIRVGSRIFAGTMGKEMLPFS